MYNDAKFDFSRNIEFKGKDNKLPIFFFMTWILFELLFFIRGKFSNFKRNRPLLVSTKKLFEFLEKVRIL